MQRRAQPGLRVIQRGLGPPVVLLHGLGSFAEEMLAPLKGLASSFRLIAPDRPGYGYSTYSIGEDPAWFSGFLAAHGIHRPIVVAHSIGSIVALRHGLDHPNDVAGMVLLAPFCRPTPPARMPLLRLAVAPVIGGFIRRRILPFLLRRSVRSHVAAMFAPEKVAPSFAEVPLDLALRPDVPLAMARDLRGFNAAAAAIARRVQDLEVPTVIVAGGQDPIAGCERHARWLARRTKAATFMPVAGAGHMLHHTHPRKVVQAVRLLA